MGPRAEPADRFYAVLRLVARFWLWFLFRDVVVRDAGRVPPEGPVLLCVNHPNNLIDSLLVGAVLPRKVHYLANASLFRNPVLAAFLTRAGAIPVYRRRDDPDRAERHADTFAACSRALDAGYVLAIYPEGTTHAEARVQRIKTGAARIALDYEVERHREPRPPLALVPVGLSFEARKSFRARVLVAFGDPVPLGSHAARAHGDPVAAVHALTDAIQTAMEAQIVHVDRIDAAEVVRAVEELYRDELARQLRAERGLAPEAVDVFRLSRAIAAAVAHFKTLDPDRIARIWQRIQHYRALLAEWHVRDQAVGARLRVGEPGHPFRTSGEAVAGFPVFLYGAVVNALPYYIPRWLAQALGRKETDYATVRLLSSVVAFPVCWGLETWLVWRVAGSGWAIAFAASLPLSGLAAYHYLRGLARLRARTHFAILALTRRQAASRILIERQAILGELDRAKADFLATRDAEHTLASRTSAGITAPEGPGPEPARRTATGGARRPEGPGREPARRTE
jgi:1-acyl-sn-glycerol-3-phosphate acyltransferase